MTDPVGNDAVKRLTEIGTNGGKPLTTREILDGIGAIKKAKSIGSDESAFLSNYEKLRASHSNLSNQDLLTLSLLDAQGVVKLGSVAPADLPKLAKVIKQNPAAFHQTPKMVDVWVALAKKPGLRQIAGNLKTLADAEAKFTYDGETGLPAIAKLLDGHKSAQKFIENLKAANQQFGNIGGLTFSGIKAGQECKLSIDGVPVGKIIDGNLPPGTALGAASDVLKNSKGEISKKDQDLLPSLSKDFAINPNLKNVVGGSDAKLKEWKDLDKFITSKPVDDPFWKDFKGFKGDIELVRKQAMRALEEYPQQYVKALEEYGMESSELYTRHGVDYGEEYFKIIKNFMSKDAYGLTKAEVYAIFGYTTNFFYSQLNYWARVKINADKSRAITGIINDGLNKLPSWNKQKFIHRGIRIKPPNQMDQINSILANYVQGTKVTEHSFTSVSAHKNTKFMQASDTKIKMKVELKPNSGVKDITGLSDGVFYRGFPRPELLLPTNSSFLVKNIKEKDGVFTIYLKEL